MRNPCQQLRRFALYACLCLCATLPVAAADTATAMTPHGQYRYVYKFFFKLYDLTLLAPSSASRAQILNAEVGFELRFSYLRTLEKPLILESAARMLERNLSAGELAQIEARVQQINAAYTTVRDGDRSSLRYQPGCGTTLAINGRDMITVPGQDFAQLYFKIWLGPQPTSKAMKEALLPPADNHSDGT